MGWEELRATNLPVRDGEVMAAIERVDSPSRFILADVSRDHAWITIEIAEAVELAEHQ